MRKITKINKIKNQILTLKVELEERYTDYYSADLFYQYNREIYGRQLEMYSSINSKEIILEDIDYILYEIQNLEDRLSITLKA